LVVLNAEQLMDYARAWRSLAREWAARAGKNSNSHGSNPRHMAQMALYAAHEAEKLVEVSEGDRTAVAHAPSLEDEH
jgi:hypothetical protein